MPVHIQNKQLFQHLWKHQPANSEASKAAEPPDWRCHHVHPELSELEPLIIRGTTISAGHGDYVRRYPYWSIRLEYSRVDVIWLYQRVPPDKLTSRWKITSSMKSHKLVIITYNNYVSLPQPTMHFLDNHHLIMGHFPKHSIAFHSLPSRSL